MNGQKMNTKFQMDTADVKKDLHTLVGDSAAMFGKFEQDVNQATDQAKEDLTTWVNDGITHMSEKLGKFSGDAKEAVVGSTAAMKKDVGQGLSQYNAKVEEAAGKVPGDFGGKAAKYPWVLVTIALVVGFVLGNLLKPARHDSWYAQI